MTKEERKAARAKRWETEAQQAINKADASLERFRLMLWDRRPAGIRDAADSLGYAVKQLRRIANSLEPKHGKCSSTCPELCPNHQQLKIESPLRKKMRGG